MFAVEGRFGDRKYEISFRDQNKPAHSTQSEISSGVYAFVYDAGTKDLSTIFADSARTALANPITRAQMATDGGLVFYSESTGHDIYVAHEDGSVGYFSGVTDGTHLMTIDRSGADKLLIAPFASATSEADLAVDFPAGAHIEHVALYVRAIDATETLDVGLLSSETNGDADGLLAAASVAVLGWVDPLAGTVGSNETFLSTASYGALMGVGVVGTDVAADFGIDAFYGHRVTGANAVSLSYTASGGSDTGVGEIYCRYKLMNV